MRIRNKGLGPLEISDLDTWTEEVSAWKQNAYAEVAKLSPAASEQLRTLDTFDPFDDEDVTATDGAQLRTLDDISETLQRLDGPITEYRQRSST